MIFGERIILQWRDAHSDINLIYTSAGERQHPDSEWLPLHFNPVHTHTPLYVIPEKTHRDVLHT